MFYGGVAYAEVTYASPDRTTITSSVSFFVQANIPAATGIVGDVRATISLAGNLTASGLEARVASAQVGTAGNITASGRKNARAFATVNVEGSIGATGISMIGRLIRQGEEQSVYTVRLQPLRVL